MSDDACDGCGDEVPDALARTVRLSVDRSNIDTQRLCPKCFADWIAHYQTEMHGETTSSPTADSQDEEPSTSDGSDIIVD